MLCEEEGEIRMMLVRKATETKLDKERQREEDQHTVIKERRKSRK